ncbi:unnamed protein product [Peniophora sp. CBMAI 1063]|nr:unnamed protein product [Peniophora sp. CBMAI 1063]
MFNARILVKNDFGEKWLAVIDLVFFTLVKGVKTKAVGFFVAYPNSGRSRSTKINTVPLWSVGHLHDAIAAGKVQNADLLKQQLKNMPHDWWFVATNHTDIVYADDQLISNMSPFRRIHSKLMLTYIGGVTHGDMAKLGYIDPEFYLLIEDVDNTDLNDPQRAHDFILASRLDISPVLAY